MPAARDGGAQSRAEDRAVAAHPVLGVAGGAGLAATDLGLSRQLGVTWNTPWRVVEPRLVELPAEQSRFDGVTTLGVDKHVWHHTPHRVKEKDPTMLTGIADLTREQQGRTRAPLLDLVAGGLLLPPQL